MILDVKTFQTITCLTFNRLGVYLRFSMWFMK